MTRSVMPPVTLALALVIFGSGSIAGASARCLVSAAVCFLVPLLNLVLGFPLRTAAAISLTIVIATSSSVSAGRTGTQLINFRLGMVLEVATLIVAVPESPPIEQALDPRLHVASTSATSSAVRGGAAATA